MPLSITIIGAGIAGLTTAIALRRQNPAHRILILEKSNRNEEYGAAMHLGPNCSGFLAELGLKLEENAGATRVLGMRQIRGSGGEERMKLDLGEISKQWKNPWWQVHRVDVHRELKRVLFDCGGEERTNAPELILGAIVEDIDVDAGKVTLADGRIFTSDVIIGADGNASFCRLQIDPDAKLKRWEKVCFRFLIPKQVLLDDPETRDLVKEDSWFSEISEADRRVIFYSCRNDTIVNVGAFIPNAEANATGHDIDWNQPGEKDTMLKAFDSWYPAARKLLSYAPEDLRVWQLFDMPTPEQWAKGRLAVIGDAAHPFLPFLGQGAAMAIEDAISVSEVLRAVDSLAEIPERLRLYESIRKERAEWARDQTRINAMNEDVRPPTKGGFVMLKTCHDYDEKVNTRDKLREWMEARSSANVVTVD